MNVSAVEYHPQRILIEADILAGMSVRAIGAKYDIPKSSVQRHRNKMIPVTGQDVRDVLAECRKLRDTVRGTDENAIIQRDSIETVPVQINPEQTPVVQPFQGQSALEQIQYYTKKMRELFDIAIRERPNIALNAVREACRLLELQSRLLGDLKGENDIKIAIILPEVMRNANGDN